VGLQGLPSTRAAHLRIPSAASLCLFYRSERAQPSALEETMRMVLQLVGAVLIMMLAFVALFWPGRAE
jgi:hypothetical protein